MLLSATDYAAMKLQNTIFPMTAWEVTGKNVKIHILVLQKVSSKSTECHEQSNLKVDNDLRYLPELQMWLLLMDYAAMKLQNMIFPMTAWAVTGKNIKIHILVL